MTLLESRIVLLFILFLIIVINVYCYEENIESIRTERSKLDDREDFGKQEIAVDINGDHFKSEHLAPEKNKDSNTKQAYHTSQTDQVSEEIRRLVEIQESAEIQDIQLPQITQNSQTSEISQTKNSPSQTHNSESTNERNNKGQNKLSTDTEIGSYAQTGLSNENVHDSRGDHESNVNNLNQVHNYMPFFEKIVQNRTSELHLSYHSNSKIDASFIFVDENSEIPIEAAFSLSMTSGRNKNGSPVGLELLVECLPENYNSVVHTLSGLFCASINFLDVENTPVYAAGTVTSRPSRLTNETRLYYGTLSRETVCTENLTPFKNLMKNRAVSGLGQMLNPLRLFDSDYYSMKVEYTPLNSLPNASRRGRLIQKIDVTFDLLKGIENRTLRNWKLSQIFDSLITRFNPLEDQSKVFIHLSKDLLKHAKLQMTRSNNKSAEKAMDESKDWDLIFNEKRNDEELSEDERAKLVELVALHPVPDKIFVNHISNDKGNTEILIEYDLLSPSRFVQDISFAWKSNRITVPAVRKEHYSIVSHRYQSGYGNLEGGLTTTIENLEDHDMLIRYYDAIPWMFRLYFHTLEISIGERKLSLMRDFEHISLVPSTSKNIPSEIEFILKIPARSRLMLSLNFDKMFLNVNQHPPDGNRGYDLSSSIVTFCKWGDEKCDADSLNHFYGSTSNRIYTESLLITLPTPDFSMPYNVIMLSSTILALFFGSLYNVLIEDDEIEEDYIKEDKAKEDKAKEDKAKDDEIKDDNAKENGNGYDEDKRDEI